MKLNKNVIKAIIEKPSLKNAPSNLFVVGRYIFENDFFNYLLKNKRSKTGEFELTSAIQKFIDDGNIVFFRELLGDYYDCGNKLGYLKAVFDFALQDDEHGTELKKYIKKII